MGVAGGVTSPVSPVKVTPMSCRQQPSIWRSMETGLGLGGRAHCLSHGDIFFKNTKEDKQNTPTGIQKRELERCSSLSCSRALTDDGSDPSVVITTRVRSEFSNSDRLEPSSSTRRGP